MGKFIQNEFESENKHWKILKTSIDFGKLNVKKIEKKKNGLTCQMSTRASKVHLYIKNAPTRQKWSVRG